VAALAPGMDVGLRFRDGAAQAEITRAGSEAAEPAKPKAKAAPAQPPRDGKQGRLL
jgi:hypothetical protein